MTAIRKLTLQAIYFQYVINLTTDYGISNDRFGVNDADYTAIVSQVRNVEFDAEIQHRMNEVHERHKTEQELATERTKQTYQHQLN